MNYRDKRATPRPKLVHQFLVVLCGTDPLVWRRIQLPERYSFWDLHVAIQDAMGWLELDDPTKRWKTAFGRRP